MTPTRERLDQTLRNYALGNLRAAVRRLKDGDDAVSTPSGGRDWRAVQLDKAVKWAQIAEALRPDPPVYYEGPMPDGIAMEVRTS